MTVLRRFPSPSSPRRVAFGLLASALVISGLVLSPPATAQDEAQEHVKKMAREHANDHAGPSPAAAAEPAAAISEAEVSYGSHDGKKLRGFLARPEGVENAPGVIVIHEWWGLNDNIRSMARQLAGQGYQALAVDIYGVPAATERDQARALMSAAMEAGDAVDANLKQAHDFLVGTGAPKVGSIGWCFGGGMSLRTALLLPDELDAAVIYYGRLVTDEAELKKLQLPVLGLFGSEDRGIPLDSVHAFEAALDKLGKQASIHVYEGANHAFANPSGSRYDEKAAKDAWAKTLAFFGEHLR